MLGLYHLIALGLFVSLAAPTWRSMPAFIRTSATGGSRASSRPCSISRRRPMRPDVGRLARRPSAVRGGHFAALGADHRRLFRARAVHLRLAPDDAQCAVPVALVPPAAPQRRTGRHLGRLLLPPVRHARLGLPRQPRSGARLRDQCGGGDHHQRRRDLHGHVPACEHPDAALDRLSDPAAGEPLLPSRAGRPCPQLWRPAVVRHDFGTFHNPARFEGECGFYEGGSARVGAMLAGRAIA